ncbi:hypothetical protein A2V71_03140 [Candidatus Berkelbacteria bacterium RBG_13_40_8]|uniref:Uncharacterized protein n=1 Tax=Candidatus Berkelbacteria bacterium RBG_13_40_8 TaxID=1797467 RepID=A0A1F5DPJ8_9BACT|nr:MAG: hypothetical protein A2V71_03140 [Candidatus Berkelbacteria bacterium RBG_13_40_8]
MKKILNFCFKQLKFFIFNPFWKTWVILAILIVTAILNSWIWYSYITKFYILVNPTPIGYSSAVFVLNLILANIIFPKHQLVSYILVGVGLLIQAFILVFLQMSIFSGAF